MLFVQESFFSIQKMFCKPARLMASLFNIACVLFTKKRFNIVLAFYIGVFLTFPFSLSFAINTSFRFILSKINKKEC